MDDLYERAAREGVVVEHSGRGLVRLTGPQRVWFLQNTITADVEPAATGSWVESCFLEPKGHVLAHMRVGIAPEEIWLDVDPPASELVDWFVRYRFRTKVEITDATGRAFTVIGPAAEALAGPGELRVGAGVTFGDRLGDVPVAVFHGDGIPPEAEGLRPAPDSLYEVFRIEAGVGRFGSDYGPRTLPQEAGLARVVSVDKGCYVGQEVVARIHFRGHVNRTLRTLAFTDVAGAAPGAGLEAGGRRVGEITSFATSPRRGPVGIGMVLVRVEAGTALDVEGGGVAVVGPVPEGTKVETG